MGMGVLISSPAGTVRERMGTNLYGRGGAMGSPGPFLIEQGQRLMGVAPIPLKECDEAVVSRSLGLLDAVVGQQRGGVA